MTDDPYRRVAGVYDRIFEPMNKGLRILGARMFTPPPDGKILDVGCGTGAHLDIYRKIDCNLYGIDASQSMLEIAQNRLGERADLRLATAAELPYKTDFFDLVISMLVLHELEASARIEVLNEMMRVVIQEGRILLIDFHAEKVKPIRGWLFKLVILASEIAAGSSHFQSYRHFMSIGGLPALIEETQFRVDQHRIVGGGNMALYLLARV